jgi:hypothetical protein
MNPSIPVFSSQKRFSNMVSENQARSMLSAGTHDLVRSRSGNVRMLYERTSVAFGQPGEDHFRCRWRWRRVPGRNANLLGKIITPECRAKMSASQRARFARHKEMGGN